MESKWVNSGNWKRPRWEKRGKMKVLEPGKKAEAKDRRSNGTWRWSKVRWVLGPPGSLSEGGGVRRRNSRTRPRKRRIQPSRFLHRRWCCSFPWCLSSSFSSSVPWFWFLAQHNEGASGFHGHIGPSGFSFWAVF